MTEYVVLRKADYEGADAFVVVARLEASGSQAAIRAAVNGGEVKPLAGEYVAVPSRSFVPVTVNIEVPQPQLRLQPLVEPRKRPKAAPAAAPLSPGDAIEAATASGTASVGGATLREAGSS